MGRRKSGGLNCERSERKLSLLSQGSVITFIDGSYKGSVLFS